jgi:putative CocE/NonD family hydrolase
MRKRRSTFLALSTLVAMAFAPLALGADNHTVQKNVMIPMKDGTSLAANLFLPTTGEKVPAILIRTPYGKGNEQSKQGKRYAASGYAVVIQDCRGRGDSQGTWEPFVYDRNDGLDTQQWIGRQAWSNGEIGTSGGSYVGFTQWISAPQASPYLKTMVPKVPFNSSFRDITYVGGAYQLALCMSWGAMMGAKDFKDLNWDRFFHYLPLETWDEVIGQEVFYLRDWVAHPTYDDYWKKRGIDDRFADITVPIFNIGGWYDIFSKATIDMIDRVQHQSRNKMARRNQCVIMGPWTHGISPDGKVGEVNFGKEATLDVDELEFQWFEYWLKGKDTGIQDWPAYRIFVMGENTWRESNQWPLQQTRYTKCFLHSQGHANTLNGDGRLDLHAPEDEQADTFVYDPQDPVPTHGGNNLFGAKAGPYDQQGIEARQDVLVYTSEALPEPVEVTGPVNMVLFASSTAPDTDFTAKLVDVYPDGRAINLCEGIIRARYRNSDSDPSLIEPQQIYRYEIDLWVTSNVFLPDHRIRLEISSSNFPRFDRNPNSGKQFGTDTELRKATQTIYHDPEHPSHLVLPMIPAD